MQDKLKKLGLSRTCEVGKKIGGYLYFHKSYLGRFAHLDIESFAAYLPADFEYHIIKVGKSTVSFISCPTFDDLEEPIVGASVQVDENGNMKFTPQASNPLLYHHRWMFVADTYDEFCIDGSKRRSCWWKAKVGNNKEISSRIGRKAYWEKLLIHLEVGDLNCEN
ncbi:conserved hypothetical protein [Vibrio crassostreae]|nr:conserved hypothetical protein [Vibrio chagasii]CAK2846351.1 conserved hypothetical protein [Vibrio crassostreae]